MLPSRSLHRRNRRLLPEGLRRIRPFPPCQRSCSCATRVHQDGIPEARLLRNDIECRLDAVLVQRLGCSLIYGTIYLCFTIFLPPLCINLISSSTNMNHKDHPLHYHVRRPSNDVQLHGLYPRLSRATKLYKQQNRPCVFAINSSTSS